MLGTVLGTKGAVRNPPLSRSLQCGEKDSAEATLQYRVRGNVVRKSDRSNSSPPPRGWRSRLGRATVTRLSERSDELESEH